MTNVTMRRFLLEKLNARALPGVERNRRTDASRVDATARGHLPKENP
jgi:hypothetical protein